MKTVLVVDDAPNIVELLRLYLEQAGYATIAATDGPTALELHRRHRPDLVVLDVMLPGLDGFEVCRAIRREADTPILMLTARSDDVDAIVGLELGADDYVTKPFNPRALVARVRAILRRTDGTVRLGRPIEVGPAADRPAPSRGTARRPGARAARPRVRPPGGAGPRAGRRAGARGAARGRLGDRLPGRDPDGRRPRVGAPQEARARRSGDRGGARDRLPARAVAGAARGR